MFFLSDVLLITHSVLTEITMVDLRRQSTGLGLGLGGDRATSSSSASCIVSNSTRHDEGLPAKSSGMSSPRGQLKAITSLVFVQVAHSTLTSEIDHACIPSRSMGIAAHSFRGTTITGDPAISRLLSVPTRTRSHPTEQTLLHRQKTLLSADASPAKQAAQLKSLLGSSTAKIKAGASVVSSPAISSCGSSARAPHSESTHPSVVLEKSKSRASVEVDLMLSYDNFVQGQGISGKLVIRIPKRSKRKSPVLMKDGKLRVVGFECLSEGTCRHMFYQYSQCLEDVSYASGQIYLDGPEQADGEGYRSCREGNHTFPFEMQLPARQEGGDAKGVVELQGAAVRYIIML